MPDSVSYDLPIEADERTEVLRAIADKLDEYAFPDVAD